MLKKLSKQEIKVTHFIANGFIMKEIADKLCISLHTVKRHYENIRAKIGARNIADVTRTYLLALDDPRDVFKMLPFLLIHLHICFHQFDDIVMRTQNNVRVVKIARKSNRKIRNYGNV